MNANQDENRKDDRKIQPPSEYIIFFFLKMCLRNDCNLNEFSHVSVLNFNDFGEKISLSWKTLVFSCQDVVVRIDSYASL